MTETARILELDKGVVAVNSSEQIEAVMFNRELIAGLEFDLPAVNIRNYCVLSTIVCIHFNWFL